MPTITPQIIAFGSVPQPVELMPVLGGTWLGAADVFAFDPLSAHVYAICNYQIASPPGPSLAAGQHSILSVIDRTSNTRVQDQASVSNPLQEGWSLAGIAEDLNGAFTLNSNPSPAPTSFSEIHVYKNSNGLLVPLTQTSGTPAAGQFSYTIDGSGYLVLSVMDFTPVVSFTGIVLWRGAPLVVNSLATTQEQVMTNAISNGTYLYVLVQAYGKSYYRIQKLSVGDITAEVASSAITAVLPSGYGQPMVRMWTSNAIEYVAVAAGRGLFIIRTDTMATVVETLDVTQGTDASWSLARMASDGTNLWLGSSGGDSAVPLAGVATIAVTSNVLTVTVNSPVGYAPSPGNRFIFKNLQTATFLNGQILTAAIGTTGTTLVFNFTHADYPATADSGTAALYPGNDLIQVTVDGAISIFDNVWPEDTDGSAIDTANYMLYDPGDNTLMIGDQNRPWRKISLDMVPPQQVQVMEADSPGNLYQCQETGLTDSAQQHGFGTSGTEYQAISCLGNTSTLGSYSILLPHSDQLGDVVVYGQNGNQGQSVAGPLFDPITTAWLPDPAAINIFDVIADNTPQNPHAANVTLWTIQNQ